MTNTLFKNPFRPDLEVRRYPNRPRELLQAFDASDELLIEHVGTLDLSQKRILVVNDSFGALTSALSSFRPESYTDSFVSAQGIQLNVGEGFVPFHDLGQLSGVYDLVLIRLPKSNSFLEDILARLSHHLKAGSQVICAYMIKHQSKTSFDLLERLVGKTHTSLAQKKARLIFAEFQKTAVKSPYPSGVKLDGFEKPFIHHSNLFSREKLDVGTRFFIEHFPEGDFKTVLDLGCANGVVGILAKGHYPEAKIVFSDDSFMAVESARVNYQARFDEPAEFLWTNSFENQPEGILDLVLCNPPFHQHHSVGDAVAQEMFRDAHRSLKTGGRLSVVGNSHLQYQAILRKIFGNSEKVASNAKFTVIEALR